LRECRRPTPRGSPLASGPRAACPLEFAPPARKKNGLNSLNTVLTSKQSISLCQIGKNSKGKRKGKERERTELNLSGLLLWCDSLLVCDEVALHEEEVLHSLHAKKLQLATSLRTDCTPHIRVSQNITLYHIHIQHINATQHDNITKNKKKEEEMNEREEEWRVTCWDLWWGFRALLLMGSLGRCPFRFLIC